MLDLSIQISNKSFPDFSKANETLSFAENKTIGKLFKIPSFCLVRISCAREVPLNLALCPLRFGKSSNFKSRIIPSISSSLFLIDCSCSSHESLCC